MTTRRDFLKLGALFVPAAIVAPRVAYSFLGPSRPIPIHQPPIEWQHRTIWTIKKIDGEVLYHGPDPGSFILAGDIHLTVRYGAPR